MKTEQMRRLEKLLDRALSEAETERLVRIKNVLGLADDDTVWDILAAMEYQRSYYEELPQKIAAASAEILQGISLAAEKEMGRAQSLLAESVAEQAKKISLRINMETLLPMGLVALISLLAYGSLLMWAGFLLGSDQVYSPAWLLRMPSGLLMGGLCLAGGLFLGVYAGQEFAKGHRGWWKRMLVALAKLVAGVSQLRAVRTGRKGSQSVCYFSIHFLRSAGAMRSIA